MLRNTGNADITVEEYGHIHEAILVHWEIKEVEILEDEFIDESVKE